jgi:DNA-binding IscR family transcriptional regulator
MRLSKDSQLAVTVLLAIGLHEHDGPVSLVAIQSRHESAQRLEDARRSRLADQAMG